MNEGEKHMGTKIMYNHKAIEKKWREKWAENSVNPRVDDNGNKKQKYYCLDMFPYPSGNGLHVGHWRGYVISDVWSRYKLQQGYYIVQFLNGIKFYIAITKVRSIAMASLLLDNWTIDEKGIITANYDTLKSSDMKNFSIEMIRKTKTMTLQEYLKSDLAKERALHLDLSYRERYLEELHKAGLDGRLRPLKKE